MRSIILILVISVAFSRSEDQEIDYESLRAEIKSWEHKTVVDLIVEDGYPVESHYVTTEDGYILNMHRIPHGLSGKSNGKVAFLQHGVLESSADFLISGPGRALGYILADEGYDVWLGNFRGNRYSRNHTKLNPNWGAKFWKFDWHEQGIIDLPTMIDYVLKQTGVDAVYYAGHSQGTTSFYVMTSLRPAYNEKIKVHVSLAPIAFMNHMTSPLLRIISWWDGPLDILLGLIGMHEFMPSKIFLTLDSFICQGFTKILCENALFAIAGFSPAEMNMTLFPKLMAFTPAGASTRQLLHYAQEIATVIGHFRQWDYGPIINLAEYGRTYPPEYPLQKVTAPVYLIYSKNDWLAAETDVKKLHKHLGNAQGLLLVEDHGFNHLDFLYGINAYKYVYPKVVDIFDIY
ncbi:unnamed protein product [Callosobruchus maculatus]|uniref:Lipase n=1 Tax=Callosobruchus maculatus TaxID=64391 RepID=A0A653CTQ8_CALMS|nr:unnamed protein product [Callosobruchus maculatus]